MRRVKENKYYRTVFVALFSFCFGCMLTLNLTPIDKTCILDNTDREYNIMQNSKLKNPELIILILSAPKNLDRRNVVRQTWLTLDEKSTLGSGVKYRFRHYFTVGTMGLTSDQILHLSAEQSQYSDMLLLPMYDDYTNLTGKVLKSFEWLDGQFEYGLGFKYVLKCDDDTFVNINSLLTEIPKMEYNLANSNLQFSLNLPPEKLNHFITTNVQINDKNKNVPVQNISIYWGYFHGSAKVQTSGKWTENNWIFCDKYIPYALGGGYILSKSLVSYIGKNIDHLRTFKSEDVSVGLWLSSINNVIRIHDIRFDTEWTTRGCKNDYLITHNISPEAMTSMHENLVNNKQLCIKEGEKRKYYLYDWSVPPSQCCVLVK